MKHSLQMIWFCMIIGFLPSCEKSTTNVTESNPTQVAKVPDYEVGKYDKNGRLVFWQMVAVDEMKPFVLQDDYGVMMINEGGEEAPKASYILACQSPIRIFTTSNFQEFAKALSELPKSAAVGKYDTCSVSRAYGLSDDVVEEYAEAIEKLRSTHAVEEWTVCICPERR